MTRITDERLAYLEENGYDYEEREMARECREWRAAGLTKEDVAALSESGNDLKPILDKLIKAHTR